MFEKLSEVAEQLATNASRRQFLGWLGTAALAAAAAIGGLLVLPGEAAAARRVRLCGEGSDPICFGQAEGFSCGAGEGQCKRSPGTSACGCVRRGRPGR